MVEKLSIRLKQQAVAARAEALARTVEELRSRHTGLPVRMADSDSTASGMVTARTRQHLSQSLWDLNHYEMMALLESSPPECSVLSK